MPPKRGQPDKLKRRLDEDLRNQIENLKFITKNQPEDMVGMFIYIYWKGDDLWYRAQIIKFYD